MTSLAARCIRIMLFVAALASWATVAQATDPSRTLAQLHHTALRAEDGAPPSVASMAQTEDGWFWMSTRMGLYRYDGFGFEQFSILPPGSNESEATWNVYAAPGGDLWVARAYGGAARVRDGKITLYGDAEGLPDHVPIDEFATDGDGGLWGSSEVGVYRFDGSHWKEVSGAWGLPREVAHFFEDPRGNLWAVTDDQLYLLRKHAHRFEKTGIAAGKDSWLLMNPDGSLWQRTQSYVHRLPGEWGEPFAHPAPRRTNSTPTTFDRDGNLWSVSCEANLCRMARPDFQALPNGDIEASSAQKYSEDLGMTSQATMMLMEDRDGHIWVSTKVGLDTFRDSWLSPVHFPKLEVYFALVEDGTGQLWAGTTARTSYPDMLWKLTPDPVLVPGFEGAVNSAYRDKDGSVWLGGSGKLWHMVGEELHPVPVPGIAAAHGTIVQSIARDGQGRLWISLRMHGLYVQTGDEWLPSAQIAPFPALAPAVIQVDAAGKLWAGYLDGTVAVLDGNKVRTFGSAEGLGLGPVSTVTTIGDLLVVGSEHGLSYFDGKRFQRVAAEPMGTLDSITGIAQATDGSVWAYGVPGVIRFTAEEWKAATSAPTQPANVQILTMEDGAPGPTQMVRPLPTVLAAGDGRMWFAGSQGLAWLDPLRRPILPSPPPVVIKSVRSGGRLFRPGDKVDLHKSRDLEISYTALAPGHPRGLSFRYRMEGSDLSLQEAGSRREAHYTDLDPGNYTFWVEASYDGQHWSRSKPFAVVVTPHLYERGPFQALCVLIAGILVWGAHRWRVRLLTRRLRLRLDERHGERERIARELHDTLLQGMQGLILKFQAFVDGLATDDGSRAGLERTIDRAESLLVEGRDRVKGLRSQVSEEGTLEARIARLADDVGTPVSFATRYGQRRRQVNPMVIDEIQSIVREAVINAIQHSSAQSIRISIEHLRRSLKVCVRDDGHGFVPSQETNRGNGHFGIVGMRERAVRMGGRLIVQSAPQRGTSIKMTIPSRVAYECHQHGVIVAFILRLVGRDPGPRSFRR